MAGYLMAKRGLSLEAVYFNAYPYTSREAWEKVRDLARRRGPYAGGMVLHTLSFTEIQTEIKRGHRKIAPPCSSRAAMMQAAASWRAKSGPTALVTGESLGQVASQTAENIRFAQARDRPPGPPAPRSAPTRKTPSRIARAIGTYEISILPYEDCCVLFSPGTSHPEVPDGPGLGSLRQYRS
ncbi:MAG: hypothetical protein MZV70_05735 [Desulfobacterales bacterium]|nr:hypothetical protein [Desulfobacterales bacterium]